MSPQNETRLLELLERLVIAVEKGGLGVSGAGGAVQTGGWRSMKVPKWAKYDAGVPFGELNDKGLAFWVSGYVPKPFEKRDGTVVPPSAVDMALRKALDQAAKELGLPLPDGYEPPEASKPAHEADPDAFQPPVRPTTKPTPPPQDNIDEDVPF